jgi:Putative beta-barrel porin-2, OmpL-like. bbp2
MRKRAHGGRTRIPAAAAAAVLGLAPLAVAAAEAAAPAPSSPVATLEQTLAASGISADGYVDVSYQHMDGAPLFTSSTPTAPVYTRAFDNCQDCFSLHQAALTVGYQPKEGFGALVNLIAGDDPDVFAPYDINPNSRQKFDFPQAYVQYADGRLTVIGGRYVSLAGAETIDPRPDANFSRSILFMYAVPFTHTGVRTTFVAGGHLTLIAGIVNGWDTLKDTNTDKTAELGLALSPGKAFTLAVNSYLGRERVGGLTAAGPQGMRTLVDVIGTWTVSDTLTVVVNYDYGTQKGTANTGFTPNNAATAIWDGVAGYLNYKLDDRWRVSLRGEYFDDADGYRTGLVQKWKEVTLTLGYAPAPPVELRFELRGDWSDHPVFVKDSGSYSPGAGYAATSDHQGQAAVEALFRF